MITAWNTGLPEEVGLSSPALDQMASLVEGRGCVVRHDRLVYTWGDPTLSGDLASASKPLLSTLLLFALQEGRLSGPDDRLAEVEPRLANLNGGKDAKITWRHLASQTSGYGLSERPGEAYAYNDFALALYFETLMGKVFHADGTQLLRERLAEPLGFEDPYTYDTYPNDRPGRLSLSPRDFARFGLLWLNDGTWQGAPLLRPDLMQIALNSAVPAKMPHTRRVYTDMLPGQRSMGGTRHITTEGPGHYSFNWWLNTNPASGAALYPALPRGAFLASGHGAQKALWVIPEWDMVVTWITGAVKMVENGMDEKVTRATEKIAAAVRA